MMASWDRLFPDGHALVMGGTRRGKSGLLQLIARSTIARGFDGLTLVDPHGECARAVAEWLANPANGQQGRRVHLLDFNSSSCFALNIFEGADTWDASHDRALLLASTIESTYDAPPELTVRLSRITYCAGMLCARKNLTLLEMLELLSLGGEELRRSVLQDFDNRVIRRELEDLQLLADKQPQRFLEYVESTRNRFVRFLGDKRLARVLGQQKGLDARAVMDNRDIVLVDLSALAGGDAAFIGTLLTCMYFAAAKQRPPLQCARHRFIGDEMDSMICMETARLVDQCAKFGLNLVCAIQRLGQLRDKGPYIADSLLTNCATKIVFGGLEVESARYMAETLFTGHLDLQEWKDKSARPTAVGQEKTTVRNWSRAVHEAEHETRARTRSHSRGEAVGSMTATSTGTGEFTGSGDMSALVLAPPATLFGPNAPNASALPMPLSQTKGDNRSRGSSRQSARSTGTSRVSIETFGEAETVGHGRSRGTSLSEGENEVFVTKYECLPTTLYTLEEQLHRMTGELMNFPRRECYVKHEGERPFRTRTADLTPAFRSSYFKRMMVPIFLRAIATRSPYLVPTAEADAAISNRVAGLLAPPSQPEANFTAPEPLPVLDRPDQFAAEFWRTRRTPGPNDDPPKPKPKKPRGRRPIGDLRPRHDRFRVVDGDKKD